MGSNDETVVAQLRSLDEAWRIFDGLGADTAIPTELAAVFLGISERTLARLRASGDGPPYLQYPDAETVRRNQRVNYILSDLRAWRAKQRVSSTMEAATARGLTFATRASVFDETQPFWAQRMLGGERPRGAPEGATLVILAHALVAPEDWSREWLAAAVDPAPAVEIVHLTLSQALCEAWDRSADRLPFHRAYVAALKHEMQADLSRQEVIELAEEMSMQGAGGSGSGGGSGDGGSGGDGSGGPGFRPPRRPRGL